MHVAQASANTTRSQSDAAQTSAQVHVAVLARNVQSRERMPRPERSVGGPRQKTNVQMETTTLFGRLANHRIISPPVRFHLYRVPPCPLTLRSPVIFSPQHLPVQSHPRRHRIAPQIKIRCGRSFPAPWIFNSCADPAPSCPLLPWSTPERHGGTIFLIRMHPPARKRLRTSELIYRFSFPPMAAGSPL